MLRRTWLMLWIAALVAWIPAGCVASRSVDGEAQTTASRYEFARVLMGTRCRIVVYSHDESLAVAACRAAFERIAEIDSTLSDYNPKSEASRLAASPPGAWHSVSPILFEALSKSDRVHALSSGAFDPTIGPATRLWRDARKQGSLPSDTDVSEALTRIGWHLIELDNRGRRVRLGSAGMRLDFGGIGKGLACDHAGESLREWGITRFLIDFGGDVLAGDPSPGDPDGWRVTVRSGGGSDRTITLRRAAVATSGDLEQFIEVDGVRYSHILDPATGIGLRGRIAASVVAPEAWLADALASAACVGGQPVADRLSAGFEGVVIELERADDPVQRAHTEGDARTK
ncbi:MAG: FAD:protein FMN transferase [Phycisphaerales bacterium]